MHNKSWKGSVNSKFKKDWRKKIFIKLKFGVPELIL
jgi:hypothetical protein